MASYLVRTPGNPDYAGKVFGIAFANGRAIVSDQTVDKRLGWSVAQIVHSMKNDFGYDVMELAAPAGEPYQVPEGYELIPKRKVNKEIKDGALVLKEEEPAPEVKAEDIPGNVGLVGGPEPVYQHESVLTTGEIDASKPEPASESTREPEPAAEPEPASPKQKRATRRKGAEESDKPAG